MEEWCRNEREREQQYLQVKSQPKNSSTKGHVVDHNSNNLEEVGTTIYSNPEVVGRRHNNAEQHHSGSSHNMGVEYHIMDHTNVLKSFWLMLACHLHTSNAWSAYITICPWTVYL